MTKQELFEAIKTTLRDHFEIPEEAITPTTGLFTELDIDSIDAVDLVAQMRVRTGARLQPESFKAVRTIQDVVDALHDALHSP